VVIGPFQAFADSVLMQELLTDTCKRAEPRHFVKSAAPSGSSRLHSSM